MTLEGMISCCCSSGLLVKRSAPWPFKDLQNGKELFQPLLNPRWQERGFHPTNMWKRSKVSAKLSVRAKFMPTHTQTHRVQHSLPPRLGPQARMLQVYIAKIIIFFEVSSGLCFADNLDCYWKVAPVLFSEKLLKKPAYRTGFPVIY